MHSRTPTCIRALTRSRVLTLLVALGVMAGSAFVPGTAGAATATVGHPAVDCGAGTSCMLTWDATTKPVTVYAGTTPDAIDRKHAVAQAEKGATGTTVGGLDPTARYYFALSTGAKGAPVVADRGLHFASAPNFRDVGGYETTDGHTVQWGKVYRADALSKLSDADFERMSELGIKVVCDFRGTSEVTADGADRLPAGAELVALPLLDESNDQSAQIRAAILSGDRAQQDAVLGNGKAAQILVDGGKFLVTSDLARKQYHAMLERLADPGSLPTVLHCTAGKDRTGWASAIVLTLLGVPKQTVVADYLATNDYIRDLNETRINQVRGLLYDPELLRPLLEVRPEYIQASFDAVQQQYGSFANYLKQGLGIDKKTQQRIKQNLLEG